MDAIKNPPGLATGGIEKSFLTPTESLAESTDIKAQGLTANSLKPSEVEDCKLFGFDLLALFERFIEECIKEALPRQWEKRAQVFEWARPRPDDFNGQASEFEIAKRDKDLAATAAACRLHAAVMRGESVLDPFNADDACLYASGLKAPHELKEVA